MEEKPITNRENPVHKEDSAIKAEAKIVNLYPEKTFPIDKETPLVPTEEISKLLSVKINEYDKNIEKAWKYNPTKRKLKDTLKNLKSIQELIIFGDKASPKAIKKSPDEINMEILEKIDNLSGVEDLKELCEKLKEQINLETEIPELHQEEAEEVEEIITPVSIEMNDPSEETVKPGIEQNEEPIVEIENSVVEQAKPDDQTIIKDEILNILEKKEDKYSKKDEKLNAIIENINDKIKEIETVKEKTSIIRYKKRKELEVILGYLETIKESIETSGTVRPDLLYRIEKIEGLYDLYKSISSEKSIEKRFFPRSK